MGRAAIWVILIWVASAASRTMVMSKPELLPRVMSESIVLLQLGSVMISVAQVGTGVHWNLAVLSQPHPSQALG